MTNITQEDWTQIAIKCRKKSDQLLSEGVSPLRIEMCMELYNAGDRSPALFEKMRESSS